MAKAKEPKEPKEPKVVKPNKKEVLNSLDKDLNVSMLSRLDKKMTDTFEYDYDAQFYFSFVFPSREVSLEFLTAFSKIAGTPEDETKDAMFFDGLEMAKRLGIKIETKSFEKLHKNHAEALEKYRKKFEGLVL